jgi:hypothetical protein
VPKVSNHSAVMMQITAIVRLDIAMSTGFLLLADAGDLGKRQ